MNERFGKLYQEVIITGIWAKLPPIAKAIYPVLLRYAHITTKICTPTQRTIEKDSGVYWRTVPKAVEILEEHKLVKTWTMVWHGKRRIHYQILDPKTGIVPSTTAIYPRKKRHLKTARGEKGRFVSSSAVQDGIYSALRNGSHSAVPNGNKREIVKRDKKENNKENTVNTLFSLFEKETKGTITKEEITETLLANWGEDPWIAEQRAKMAINGRGEPSSDWWQFLMSQKVEIDVETLN